ncbi:hypothetical protein C8R44DRAFT_749947 [Mycena epipterygia]|nr:hypothetical protein C8R44DRAFT_749947 [Mycena epipterygia]
MFACGVRGGCCCLRIRNKTVITVDSGQNLNVCMRTVVNDGLSRTYETRRNGGCLTTCAPRCGGQTCLTTDIQNVCQDLPTSGSRLFADIQVITAVAGWWLIAFQAKIRPPRRGVQGDSSVRPSRYEAHSSRLHFHHSAKAKSLTPAFGMLRGFRAEAETCVVIVPVVARPRMERFIPHADARINVEVDSGRPVSGESVKFKITRDLNRVRGGVFSQTAVDIVEKRRRTLHKNVEEVGKKPAEDRRRTAERS